MTYYIEITNQFSKWLHKLKDRKAKAAIIKRIELIEFTGNLGDHKAVGDNISELRFFIGPGYRVYYTIRNSQIVLLLAGGDKSSQSRDIKAASIILEALHD